MNSESLSEFFILIFIIFGSLCRIEDHCLTETDFDVHYSQQLKNQGLRNAFKESNDKLGDGSFGVVKQIDWTENGKTAKVAVKQIIIRQGESIPIVEKEMRAMKDLQNVEGIIQMKDCLVMEEQFPSGTQAGNQVVFEPFKAPVVYVVSEKLYANFAPNSNLGDKSPLAKMKNGKPLDKLRVYLKIAKALEALHSKDFVHADLKPDNIMAGNEDLQTIKLINLGLAAKKGSRYEGSAALFSPYEVLSEQSIGPAMDIYAFGMTVTAIEYATEDFEPLIIRAYLAGRLRHYVNVLADFVKTNIPRVKGFGASSASGDNFSKIVIDCVEFEPTKRPTASQVVQRISKYIATLEAAGYDQDPAAVEIALQSIMGAAGSAGQDNQKVGGLLQANRPIFSEKLEGAKQIRSVSENPLKDIVIRVIAVQVFLGVVLLIEYLVRKLRMS